MKTKIAVLFCVLMSLSACNGGGSGATSSGSTASGGSGGGGGGGGGSIQTLVQTDGCSVATNSTGGLISCGDGSSAQINNGSNGTNGSGALSVSDSSGTVLGQLLGIGMTDASGYPTVSIWNSSESAVTTYNMVNGAMEMMGLYYNNDECEGTAYVIGGFKNEVFSNNGSLYEVSSGTIDSDYSGYKSAISTTCVSEEPTAAYMTPIAAYSGTFTIGITHLPVSMSE